MIVGRSVCEYKGPPCFSKLDTAYGKICREKCRAFAFINLQSSPTYLRHPCCRPNQFLSTKRSKQVTEATPADLIDYIDFRQQTGRIKNATISRELCVIRTLYAYLFDYQKMALHGNQTSYMFLR